VLCEIDSFCIIVLQKSVSIHVWMMSQFMYPSSSSSSSCGDGLLSADCHYATLLQCSPVISSCTAVQFPTPLLQSSSLLPPSLDQPQWQHTPHTVPPLLLANAARLPSCAVGNAVLSNHINMAATVTASSGVICQPPTGTVNIHQ